MQCNITGIPTHYFNDEYTVMRIHGIPDLIYGLYGCIYCRIKANREITAIDVLVYCTCDTDTRDIEFLAEFDSASKGSVAANYHQAVNASFFQVGVSFFTTCLLKKLLASRGLKNRATTLNNICDGTGFHFHNIIFNHSLVATHDAIHFQSMKNACSYNRPDGCIHAG